MQTAGEEKQEGYQEDEVVFKNRTHRRTTYLPGDHPSGLHRYPSDSSDDDDDNELANGTRRTNFSCPDIQFCRSDTGINPDYVYWINTDGYFRENGKIAGHGLVVRDHLGNPITARSWFTEKPVSPLYHQLGGALAAYRVAKDLGIKKVIVVCNHFYTQDVLDHFELGARMKCHHLDHPEIEASTLVCNIHSNSNLECIYHPKIKASSLVCKKCVEEYFSKDSHAVQLFWPILEEIMNLATHFSGYVSLVEVISRKENTIADYMAKYGTRHGKENTIADKFPEELKSLLYDLASMYPESEFGAKNGVPFVVLPTLDDEDQTLFLLLLLDDSL